jgi:hypothetical protein
VIETGRMSEGWGTGVSSGVSDKIDSGFSKNSPLFYAILAGKANLPACANGEIHTVLSAACRMFWPIGRET